MRAISGRAAALALGVLIAAAAAARLATADLAVTAALKVGLSAICVAATPGAAVLLLWRPRRSMTLLEFCGFAAAGSFVLVHLTTVAAIATHVRTPVMAAAATALVLACLIAAAARRDRMVIELTAVECAIAALLATIAACLYVQGSPLDSFEDQVHAAIAQRLAHTARPALDAFYFAPRFVYTYPFPGTHYLVALVSVAGDVDPLFVFHKLRFFWSPVALVLLYVCALSVFGTRAAAVTVVLTAGALVLSGMYSVVPKMFWAQLAPYSHAADIAMGVLLPALLASAFGYIQSDTARERAFLLTVTLGLVFMLAVVHMREVIQFVAYLGCFVAGALLFRVHAVPARRAAALLATTVAMVLAYYAWHQVAVGHVTAVVGQERTRLLELARVTPIRDLLFSPAPHVLKEFFYGFESLFHGLTPVLLFAGPATVVAFRARPLIWLMAWSTIAYLLAMLVPAVALAYMYATYYEILFVPVRNIVFFMYLLAGGFVHVVLTRVTGVTLPRLGAAAGAGLLFGAIAVVATLSLPDSSRGFLVPLALAFAITLLYVRGTPPRPALVTALVGAAGISLLLIDHRTHAEPPPVVNVRWADGLAEGTRGELERTFGLAAGERVTTGTNVWTYRLRDTSRRNVAALVQHPSVADTHHIDRTTFLVEQEPVETADEAVAFRVWPALRYPGAAVAVTTVIVVGVMAFLLPLAVPSLVGAGTPLRPGAHLAACVLFLVPFATWSARPELSPLSLAPMPPAGIAPTPRALVEQTPCVTRAELQAPFTEEYFEEGPLVVRDAVACPPPVALLKWAREHLPPDAVLAIDRWNHYLPTTFMPQQVIAFPGFERALANEQDLFPAYYRFYRASLTARRVQPFFNDVESPAERAAFLRALGVTHVLVDPPYYDTMRAALDPLPELVTLKYAQAGWAVYEVAEAR